MVRLSRRHLVTGGLAGLGLAAPISQALAQAIEAIDEPAVVPSAKPAAPLPAVIPADETAEVDTAMDNDRILRLTAQVMINGQGPFEFVVDTGANKSVISSALAARLGLPAGRSMKVYTTVGPVETPSAHVDLLQVGDRVMRRANVPVLPVTGLRADGMLGVDWLKGERLILDIANRRLEIRKPGRAGPAGTVVPARMKSGQLTIVDADMNGRGRINAMIDSGSEVTMGSPELRLLAAQHNPTFERELQPISMIDASNRTFMGQYGFLPFVRIGGVQFGNLPIVFTNKTSVIDLWGMANQPTVILGMDVLRQFSRVELDFSQSKVGFTVLEAKRA